MKKIEYMAGFVFLCIAGASIVTAVNEISCRRRESEAIQSGAMLAALPMFVKANKQQEHREAQADEEGRA